MIDVTLYRSDTKAAQVDDIEDAETAVFVARTLWDDHIRETPGVQGRTDAMRTTFHVDGKLVRMIDGKRP